MGLKLSKREFEKHFKKHSGRLSVIKYNKMFIVYPRNKLPCPYWDENKGCGIYEERPIDCRLYPFDLHKIIEKNGVIEIEFYDQTDCPHKEVLFMPVDEAKGLMMKLAREVYGEDKPIKIEFISGKKTKRQYGFLNPIVAWLSKTFRTYR
jgi:Fe-S-cluster containining protein